MTEPPTIRPLHPSAVGQVIDLLNEATEALDRWAITHPLGEHLGAASEDLHRLLMPCGCHDSMIGHVWHDTIQDAPGQPGSALGGVSVAGSSSDPTARAATQLADRTDPGQADRNRIHRTTMRLAARIDTLVGGDTSLTTEKAIRKDADVLATIAAWRTPRQAHDGQRTATAADGDEGCQSCWRIQWWNPIYRSWRQGLLAPTVPLCRPCYERALSDGTLPSTEDVQHKRDHGRWKPRHTDPKRRPA